MRIRGGEYRAWKLGVGGARALAVRDDRVLRFGDYKRRSPGRLGELGAGGRAKVVGECTVVGPSGEGLDRAFACGVGDRLFFFQDRQVLAFGAW